MENEEDKKQLDPEEEPKTDEPSNKEIDKALDELEVIPEKHYDEPVERQTEAGLISNRPIVQEVEQSYLDYAMSVIVARALPDARDGLKPVHRRILFAMGEMNLTHSSKFTKSSKIVGEVLGKYHPHGDLAVYQTIVGMAQDFKMNHPLVDGQGNFGSMDGDSAAAPRYTEARLTSIAEQMLVDIDKNTVDMTSNYDNTLKEPLVLPTRVPNLLLNGTVGIAVGMATNIPPHNLGEICDATSLLIDNPEATIEELMKHVKGPDFPTYATIYGAEGIKNAYATGHGKIVIRGDAELIEDKKGFKIIISSIPFQVNKSDLITRIANLVKEKKLEGITDLRDESDRATSVRIVIELKSTAYPKKVLNRIYDLTSLQTAFHINMLALVDRIQPRVLNLRAALQEFITHRQVVVRRRTQFDLDKAKERAHILEGLKKALDHIDEIIKLIKESANREEAQKNLIEKFEFSVVQSNAILDMRLSALAALERQKVEDELAEKRKLIEELTAILNDPKKILAIIKRELTEIREKYATPRRTKIIDHEIGSFKAEDLIPDEQVVITLTAGNYIKRVAVDSYKKQGRGGKGIIGIIPKEEDQVLQMELASTHDNIYFFTNLGKVFSIKAYEIPPSSRQARGQAIVNLIQIAPDEKVTTLLVIPKKSPITNGFFIMATQKGVIKKTAISAYDNIRKTGLIAIKLKSEDELRFVKISDGSHFVVMISKNGSGIVFKESEARPMGRSASGVIGMRLRSSDEVISVNTFREDPTESKSYDLITVLENGYGKRTNVVKHFPVQKRGGYGVRASKISKKTGNVIGALITNNINQDLIIVSELGQVIRIPLKSAKVLGRDTQGVTLMKISSKDKVASVSNVSSKDEDELDILENPSPVEENTETKNIKESTEVKETKKNSSSKSNDNSIDSKDLKVHYYKKDGR